MLSEVDQTFPIESLTMNESVIVDLWKKGRKRRRYFYLIRVTPTVTRTDILRGPNKKKYKNVKNT